MTASKGKMADIREEEDVEAHLPCEGKTHEKEEEASAPQIHLQGSSAPGGPSPGTSSSNIRGDLPYAHRKREKQSALQYFALFALATRARLAKIFGQRRRRPWQDAYYRKLGKHSDALGRGEEVSAPSVDDKASEEVSAWS